MFSQPEDDSQILSAYLEILSEKKTDYKIYHNSYTDAIQEALDFVTKAGWKISADDSAEIVGYNSKRPREGETEKITIPLFKNEKESKKALQIQIYNRGNSIAPFELNCYVL